MLDSLRPGTRLASAFARNPSDNAWLDCVRTLAIAFVLLRHGQRVLETGPDLTFLETLSLNGWAGVDLFFVLSGYLVTSKLSQRYATHGKIDLAQYATRRIRRIVPAYFFVLLLVVVGYFPFFAVSGDNLGIRILYHVFFMQDVLPSDINVVFWSLGVEAKYYAVIPLVVIALSRLADWRHILFVAVCILALGPALRLGVYLTSDIPDYYTFWRLLRSPFYACLEPIALGAVIALAETRGWLRFGPKLATVLFCSICVTLVAYLGSSVFLENINVWDATAQPLILAVLFSFLVVAALGMKPVYTPLEPVFRVGARLSYSLYLVHFPLIPLSLALARSFELGTSGFWAIYLGTSLLHAVVILAYVEMPFMTSRRRPTGELSRLKEGVSRI